MKSEAMLADKVRTKVEAGFSGSGFGLDFVASGKPLNI